MQEIPESIEMWSQNNSEEKINCRFELLDDGGAKIAPEKNFSNNNSIKEEQIYGEFDGNKLSLINNRYERKTTSSIGNEPITTILRSNSVIVGNSYISELENFEVLELSCEIPDAELFFCQNNTHAEQAYLDLRPYNKRFNHPAGFEIILSYEHKFHDKGRSLFRLNIKSDIAKPLSEFDKVTFSIITFISFSIGKIVTKRNVSLVAADGGNYHVCRETWFRTISPFITSKAPLFFVRDIEQDVYEQWLNFMHDTEDLIRLYFLPLKFPMDPPTVFILLSQLAEGIHRKQSSQNAISYVSRLMDMASNSEYKDYIFEFINEDGVNNLCSKLKNARNYYTHYNENETYKKLEGDDISFEPMKLHLFIDLYILKHIGFDSSYFDRVKYCVIKDRLLRKQLITELTNS
ncbi:HEPN domain-containing protein [Vibrio coralliirubri]|uniref:HEPN domain-containing protein n=1 Tax=Vibrio coralliirubri TaxID=1516159 RepID=UPI0006360E9F|nr:HEPN domain-containing protein [Vibrio coralliirubri]CDU14351.1 hypothetical protein VCR17J2_640033 [Vibrio coralliirubri]